MVCRAGSADLPLHGGRVPAWLGQRMTRLGTVIVEAIVLEYGRDPGRMPVHPHDGAEGLEPERVCQPP
jgi:hypothetical protein